MPIKHSLSDGDAHQDSQHRIGQGFELVDVSGSAYCKQQSLIYHQFVYWRRKLAPTEDCCFAQLGE
ncbi:IS66 family insertion sequence element accessory protein TnpA [Marinobacter sp. ELB17]|uniref:IS66 family insertion sequence element accessory protein TnpA n=1 Tax=Marinobacter sp. ELB17 TaxID=270374 RepID=UPI0000F3703E|nr:hypothetical protein MELB17_13492 [Marinobacter sp. ELB17]